MDHQDRREGSRISICFEVKVSHASFGNYILKTTNISDSGIHVLTEGQKMPNIGSIVQVQLNGYLGENEHPPLLDMLIVRKDAAGVGLQYLSNHDNCSEIKGSAEPANNDQQKDHDDET